jgi:hypothetical protein
MVMRVPKISAVPTRSGPGFDATRTPISALPVPLTGGAIVIQDVGEEAVHGQKSSVDNVNPRVPPSAPIVPVVGVTSPPQFAGC